VVAIAHPLRLSASETPGCDFDPRNHGLGGRESQPFIPTTRLRVEANSLVGGTPNFVAPLGRSGDGEGRAPNQTTSGFDLRLTVDSSVTGRDLVRTRLRAGNTAPLPFGSSAQILRLDTPSSTAGDLIVDRLYVSVPIGDAIQVNGGALVRNTGLLGFIPSAYNSRVLDFFQLAGASGTYNRAVGSGLGIQLNHPRKADGTTVSFDLNAISQHGFADSDTGVLSSASGINVLGQLGMRGASWGAAVAYRFGSRHSWIRDPNFSPRAVGAGQQSNSVAIGAYWQPIDHSWQPSISVGYGINAVSSGSMPQSQSWMVGLQWDGLFSGGDGAGLAIGQAPFTRERSSQSWLVESFYRMQLSDAVSITTALFYASSYRENQFRPTWGGLIQTSFRF
jgi:hypothetical protein